MYVKYDVIVSYTLVDEMGISCCCYVVDVCYTITTNCPTYTYTRPTIVNVYYYKLKVSQNNCNNYCLIGVRKS